MFAAFSLSTYLPIYRSIYLPSYLSIGLSIDLSIDPSIYLSSDPSINLSHDRSIYLSIYLSICASLYLSIYQSSIYLPVHCLSLYSERRFQLLVTQSPLISGRLLLLVTAAGWVRRSLVHPFFGLRIDLTGGFPNLVIFRPSCLVELESPQRGQLLPTGLDILWRSTNSEFYEGFVQDGGSGIRG